MYAQFFCFLNIVFNGICTGMERAYIYIYMHTVLYKLFVRNRKLLSEKDKKKPPSPQPKVKKARPTKTYLFNATYVDGIHFKPRVLFLNDSRLLGNYNGK